MHKTLIALAGVTAMILLMPQWERWEKDKGRSHLFRRFCVWAPRLALFFYVLGNLSLTLLFREPGEQKQMILSLAEPFRKAAESGSLLELEGLLLNMLLFLPLGYLAPLAYKKIRNGHMLLMGVLFAGLVEGVQLVLRIGWFDVNDLFYNLLGVLFGLILLRVQQKEEANEKPRKG